MSSNTNAKDKKNDKKSLILDSAFELFLEGNYTNTKIADIASRAGIGKGTVYEYFSSKEEILLEIIRNKIIPEYESIPQIISMNATVRDRISSFLDFKKAFLKKYGAYIDDIQKLFRDADTEMSGKICAAIKQIISCEYSTMLQIIEDGIKSGELKNINPPLTAHFVVGAIASYASVGSGMFQNMQKCGFPVRHNIEEAFSCCSKDDFFELIFHGIMN